MRGQREFELLVQRYVEGQTTAEEMDRLNRRLRQGGEERRLFIELLNLDSALAATIVNAIPETDATVGVVEVAKPPYELRSDVRGSDLGRSTTPSPQFGLPKTTRLGVGWTSPASWLFATAASVLVLAGGMWLLTTQESQSPGQVFATVESGTGVIGLSGGKIDSDTWHEIEAGTVEIVTPLGARVVIEAAAKFRFESAQRLHMALGRLAANVPPTAKGFTVVTPSGQAVDLGTKFGIDVSRDGGAEVHVFQGEVIAQTLKSNADQHLTDGEALLLQSGVGLEREFRSTAFIRPEEIGSLHAALVAGQRQRSESVMAKLRDDQALISLLDFASSDLGEGTYRLVQGRWPGSRAAEFVNVGDHMKFNVGGEREWAQLTLAAWVRLDRLGAPFQSLLHTDNWNREDPPGQVHWMVTEHTTMRLALFGNKLAVGSSSKDGFYPDSRTPILPEQGRWLHLAAVYDCSKQTVRFYLNGEFDVEVRQQVAHPARLGPGQIGNWNERDRNLSGRVDELLILGRAMSNGEVRAIFAAGNPYR